MGKAGQAVRQKYESVKAETITAVLLHRIGDKQADHIRLQNIGQMLAGKDRNGKQMPGYKTATIKERARLGYQTSKVDLKRTGKFHDAIVGQSTKAIVDSRKGTASIDFEIVVPAAMSGRVKGFRTGRYGRNGRNAPRLVLGVADVGVPLRSAQEKQLRRIAAQESRKAFAGAGVTLTTKDF